MLANQLVSPTSDYNTTGDFQLINKLLQNPRYEIPERLRQKVIGCIDKVISDDADSKGVSIQTQLQAIRVLAQLDKHNLDVIKLAMPHKVETTNITKLDDSDLQNLVVEIINQIKPQCPPLLKKI